MGKFTQPDTIVPNQSDPQSWNRFSYVQNNPIRYTDPTGHYLFEEEPNDEYVWRRDRPRGYKSLIRSEEPVWIQPRPPAITGGRGGDPTDELKVKDRDTVTNRAKKGEPEAIINLLFPSHGGWAFQLAGTGGFPVGPGFGGETSVSFLYYRHSGEFIVEVTSGPAFDVAGVKLPEPLPAEVSFMSGPLVGWGQSSSEAGNISVEMGGSLSAKYAAGLEVSAPLDVDQNRIEFYVDPYYGQVPATLYGSAGVGCCGASVGGSIQTTTLTYSVQLKRGY